MERETWKPVNGYEGFYEINEQGNVKSLHQHNYGYIMNQRIDRGGYYTVRLAKPGKRSCTVYVHRLLGYAFIPNPDNKPLINHEDGNKLNNAITNLSWVTASENMKHAYQLGLSTACNCREIIDDFTGKIFPSLKEAAEYHCIEYPTFKNYMSGARPNPTSLRYRYETTSVKTYSEDEFNQNIFLANPHKVKYNEKMFVVPKTPLFIPQNTFSIAFNLSDWRCNSLTA